MAQKRDIAVCASKIQLLSKKVCYKVSLYENFQLSFSFASAIIKYYGNFLRQKFSPKNLVFSNISLMAIFAVNHPSEGVKMTNFPLSGWSPVDYWLTQSIYRLHNYVAVQSLSAIRRLPSESTLRRLHTAVRMTSYC